MNKKTVSSVLAPIVTHDTIVIQKNGERVVIRIMLVKYDGNIEVYYQERGYPFEFAFGIPAQSMKKALTLAHANAVVYLHYEEGCQ